MFDLRIAKVLTALTVIVGVVSVSARFLPISSQPIFAPNEHWRSELARVRSLDEAYPIVDKYIARSSGTREHRIASGVVSFVSDRFVHGMPQNRVQENWVSRVAALVWANLGMPVTPDSILEHRRALCSQQTIVAEALLHHYGLHYASVAFRWPNSNPYSRGHFALAAKVDGLWRYYDADLEPQLQGVLLSAIRSGQAVAWVYADRPTIAREMEYAAAHGGILVKHVDENPAPRGAFFEQLTLFLSKWGWMVLAGLAVMIWTMVNDQKASSGSAAHASFPQFLEPAID